MTVKNIADKLGLRVFSGDEFLEREVCGCYIGDLLSLAMSSVQKDNIWITIQTNVNIAAVASLTEAACVLLADGCEPDDNAQERAKTQEIVILGSGMSAYELAKSLAELGI